MNELKIHLVLLKRLIIIVKPLSAVMLLAILMGSLGHLVAIAIPSLSAFALSYMAQGVVLDMWRLGAILLVLGISRGLLHYGEQLANHYIAFKILAIIRDKVFRALRRLAPAKLETKDSGSMISILTTDIELLEVFYAHTISPVVIALVVSISVFFVLWQFHPYYALLALFYNILLSVVVPIITYRKGKETGMAQRKALSQLNNTVLDTFRGIKECIQYRYKAKALEAIEDGASHLNRLSKKLSDIMGFNMSLSLVVVLSSYPAFFLLGAWLYRGEVVGVAGLIVPIVLALSSYGPSLALASLANNLMLTFACAKRVFALLDETPQVIENKEGKEVGFQKLEVSDLSFSYDDKKVLDKVSMALGKNELVGIRGKSGTGKSTLLKLIMRYYDSNFGTIKLNDVTLSELKTSNLRKNESFVAQETYIFKDTIAANLRVAKPDATELELRVACQKASIDDFIMSLKDGYDTYLGELGERFSAGERQRLGLARAFLHDGPLMLLDEPTANIDSLNEGEILRAIDLERQDKAICIVSHRASTFSIVDRFVDIPSVHEG